MTLAPALSEGLACLLLLLPLSLKKAAAKKCYPVKNGEIAIKRARAMLLLFKLLRLLLLLRALEAAPFVACGCHTPTN